jgi:hypothetical protein
MGRGGQLCQGYSDVDLLGDGKRIVDFNSQVSHSALNLMPEEELYRTQIPGSPINQCGFRSAEGMCSKYNWVQPDARNPLCYQSRILPGCYRSKRTTATEEQKLAWPSPTALI